MFCLSARSNQDLTRLYLESEVDENIVLYYFIITYSWSYKKYGEHLKFIIIENLNVWINVGWTLYLSTPLEVIGN